MRMPLSSFLQVSLFRKGELVGSELFLQPSIIIGAGPDADLQLDDPGVGRKHAVIIREKGKITVRALGRGHLVVNEQSVRSSYVGARDKIQIGGHELRVAMVSPRPPPPSIEFEEDEPEIVAEIPLPRVFSTPKEQMEDEDEDLEEEERPGYSLVERLLALESSESDNTALEIIGWVGEEVRTTVLLGKAGEGYRLSASDPFGEELAGIELAHLSGRGEAVLEIPAQIEAKILRRGRVVPSTEREETHLVRSRGHQIRRLRLTNATAIFTAGDAGFCVRFVAARRIENEKKRLAVERPVRRAFGSAIAVHLVVGAMVGLGSSGFHYEEPKEVWADLSQKTDLRQVEVEVPPPAPPEEPEPEAQAEAEPEVEAPKKIKRPKARKSIAKTKEVKSKGILGALGKMTVQPPGRKSLVAAASNLNAVQVPGGGGFRVGALIAKAPASGISVGGGGGGKLLTRGTASLLRDGNLVAGIAKRSGSVRGRVGRASGRLLKAQGKISREEVARVINDHIREVQYCYEKNLISNAGLQGKLVLEWQIDQSGSVSRVRQKMSTLEGSAVFDCISASLRRWTFPKPDGGVVIVSYPFIFNSVGFLT